jgi:hypothetical protein
MAYFIALLYHRYASNQWAINEQIRWLKDKGDHTDTVSPPPIIETRPFSLVNLAMLSATARVPSSNGGTSNTPY